MNSGYGRRTYGRTKPVIILTGVVMVALGIAVLVNPIAAVETLVRIVGWVLVVYGIITLVSAFVKGDPMKNSPAELLMGAIALVPGLIMGLFPGALVSFVWTVIGLLILATGVLDVVEAGDLRRIASPLAMPATVSGIITAVLGLIVIIAPMFSASIGMVFAAVALFVDGITEIIFGLGM